MPQWNCNYTYSCRARAGDVVVARRTQSSLAASANGRDWVLVNASPDIGRQMLDTPELHPRAEDGLRSSPIKAVIVTNADIDHIAGLLTLRERQPFNLYASSQVLAVLAANPVFNVLDKAIVRRIELTLDRDTEILGPDGPTGIVVHAYAVPGKIALFMEDGGDPKRFASGDGDTIGLSIRASPSTGTAHYIPGCADVDFALASRLDQAECLLFDGTVWRDTEMSDAGVGEKTGRRMGHMPVSGPDGSIAALRTVEIGRRIFVHINNTNPLLDSGSEEYREAREAGWEIGLDGMEIRL